MVMHKIVTIFICLIALSTLFAKPGWCVGSEGFNNPVFGAKALSMGNTFVANADDPTAIQFNPAGLTDLEGSQASVGNTFLAGFVDYDPVNGKSDETRKNFFIAPNIYFTKNVKESRLAFGVGVTAPYGLGTKWSDTSFARYLGTESDMALVNLNPTVAFKALPGLSIGIGFDYTFGTVDMKAQNNWNIVETALNNPDIGSRPDGLTDTHLSVDDGFGYNIGLLYKINEKSSVGVSFRSKIDLNFTGNTEMRGISGALPQLAFGGNRFRTDVDADVTLPESLTIGYGRHVGDKWFFEIDVEWTRWSRFDTVGFEFEESNAMLEADNPQEFKWDDAISVGIGSEYKLNGKASLRGGYTYHETPVPGDTFTPNIPGSSRHSITTGAGYKMRLFDLPITIDAAYVAAFYEDREIENDVGKLRGAEIDGEYERMSHLFAVNFTLQF